MPLTRSLSDCLKTIYEYRKSSHTARVTDLAADLGIAKPSLNRTVSVLKKLGLVKHERYGTIDLTHLGLAYARNACKRFDLIFRFLKDTLELDDTTAKEDACGIEHSIGPETITKIQRYLESVNESPFKIEEQIFVKLSEILPRSTVRVISIDDDIQGSCRIFDLGITVDTVMSIRERSPLGDPLLITARGLSLTLRRSEAESILVEII